ncbi:type I 3-dehydroquinate dehydratase [Halorussus halophilus]|uniref:type I 3-dehydroquinate dehydratase n=1 Tax=Halorussus halophilus TaxID=2650975 RepID=UPI00130130BB|nr:type I 3-dehydroquinate dehydratase [Halorussus halophilus]
MEFEEFVLVASVTDLAAERRARDHADAVEFRMDLSEGPQSDVESYDGELPILATNRAAWEGGEAADDHARLDALAEVAEHPAVEAIDVELRSLVSGEADEVVGRARDHGVSIVASVHDFETTPSTMEMRGKLQLATRRGDVGKLAVTAHDRSDVLDLLTVTDQLDGAGERVATMAMGEAGRHSRAVAPLYGSKIGYAPVESEDATAPGQYDLETLAGLVEQLE